MSEKKRVTIYDIAREAGVSAATVSRVITGSAEVSDIKREKVLALIHQYHFRPNHDVLGGLGNVYIGVGVG